MSQMFEAVLVANRGEIALRILRACKELDIATVAVYSEADRDAPWLTMADQAYLLGPAAPAASYLNVERLLEVAQESGAQAVHPGYGFLAESAHFARAVSDAGLVWVGPPPEAIAQMGDKLSARKTAEAAGVAPVPGTLEPVDDPAAVRSFAQEHGFPVAVKAAFGGGGRGLRVIRDDRELEEALEGARRESLAAFGRTEVYVERYLPRPRHIEVQVLADNHGNCLFLGERDCSTQRRHQKLIEEAPAPGLDPDARKAMGEAAVSVSKRVDYAGAGTVEFLFADNDFYFLEMNTRLQVEHPVTELVTGIDLVHWQLRIAAGQALSFSQEDVAVRGHAVEARINAENCAAGFAPAPGLVTGWRPPAGPGVRVDAGVEAGWRIPGSYDSLVAKLIAYGSDREQARRRMLRALDEFVVEGVPTTIDFHRLAFAHPDFVAGRVCTVSVEREWDLSSLPLPAAPAAAPADDTPPRRFTVEVGGKRLQVALFEPAPGQRPRRRPDRPDRRRARTGPRPGGSAVDDLVAPMQGTIVKTVAGVGQAVAAGDLIVILEAMKMENHITAHRDGVVAALHVRAGDVVSTGDALATISDPGGGPGSHTDGGARDVADPRQGGDDGP